MGTNLYMVSISLSANFSLSASSRTREYTHG